MRYKRVYYLRCANNLSVRLKRGLITSAAKNTQTTGKMKHEKSFYEHCKGRKCSGQNTEISALWEGL